jgi:methyl-accepting chemotaxis protein
LETRGAETQAVSIEKRLDVCTALNELLQALKDLITALLGSASEIANTDARVEVGKGVSSLADVVNSLIDAVGGLLPKCSTTTSSTANGLTQLLQTVLGILNIK